MIAELIVALPAQGLAAGARRTRAGVRDERVKEGLLKPGDAVAATPLPPAKSPNFSSRHSNRIFLKAQNMSNPCGQGRRVLRAPVVLIRRLGLAAMLLLAAIGVAASAAAAPGPTAAAAQIAAKLAAAHLPEPLVAIGPTTPAEDAALLAAVARYQDRADPDDFAALTGFLAGYSHSAWRVAVLTNLGIVYLHYGYFSRSLAAYETAWHEGKDATNPRARALVDRALGELLALDADFGYRQRLAALLTEIGARPVSGSAAAMLRAAQQTLWVMKTDPKHLYLCGPMALKMLLLAQHATAAQVDFLNWERADGPQGTNLIEVAALAKKGRSRAHAGVPRTGRSDAGAVDRALADRAFCGDRRRAGRPLRGQGRDPWASELVDDAGRARRRGSGYFLVPAKAAGVTGLRQVAGEEAGHVWGAGFTVGMASSPKNKNPCSSCTCTGMCGYGINQHDVQPRPHRPSGRLHPAQGPLGGGDAGLRRARPKPAGEFRLFQRQPELDRELARLCRGRPDDPGIASHRLFARRHPLFLYRLRQQHAQLCPARGRRFRAGAEED